MPRGVVQWCAERCGFAGPPQRGAVIPRGLGGAISWRAVMRLGLLACVPLVANLSGVACPVPWCVLL